MSTTRGSQGGPEEIARLQAEVADLQAENTRLRGLLGVDARPATPVEARSTTLFDQPEALPAVFDESPTPKKVALFRMLFTGRDDVYALRWENHSNGRMGWSPAVRDGWFQARRRGGPIEYLGFDDEVVEAHLTGRIAAGLYPLMGGDTCQLLACDFDGTTWLLDALAYLDACTEAGIPAALERSRSGDGAHVWVFFSGSVPAAVARRLGVGLLREAMEKRAELDLASYDRLFPAQDFVPKKGFGNLIALPLQGRCRERATTMFLDPTTLEPFHDQWQFLSSLSRLSPDAAGELAEALRGIEAGPSSPRPYRRGVDPPAPEVVHAEVGAMVAVERIGLPPPVVASLKHTAALHNPIFYDRQRLRLSTWNTPRFVRCYSEDLSCLRLPRGLLDRVGEVLEHAGSRLELEDRRPDPPRLDLTFTGSLSSQQEAAVADLAGHDLGVLVAPPGSGKTLIACALVARHRVPTLIIVDRGPLLEQWRQRLEGVLDLAPGQIGQLGGGRNRCSGIVDVAMAQSLARRDDLTELAGGYGFVIVDECHHVPAATFEAAVKEIPARRWLGLTATPYRRDKLQEIIHLHCGPIRHQIEPHAGPAAALRRELLVHDTAHHSAADGAHIQEVFRGLVDDEHRTAQICDDVTAALARGRRCLVLTQWTQHLDQLCAGLRARCHEPLVLKGGMNKSSRTGTLAALNGQTRGGLCLVATGSYLGEGFDCPHLDTLFLAFPLAFKGRIVQYVGRILRLADDKHDVEVHDYVDVRVPVLARMRDKRRPAFQSLGFSVPRHPPRQATRRS